MWENWGLYALDAIFAISIIWLIRRRYVRTITVEITAEDWPKP